MPESTKPLVWDSEDGDYFGEGHIPPDAFRALCVEHDKEIGYDEYDEGCDDMDPARIVHEWWYQPIPENEEHMLPCDPDHPGAEPFTAWRR